MVLRALLAIDPGHPLASRLAKGLLAARNHGAWRSTDESAWALLALDDYRRAQERVTPAFDAAVLLGGAKVEESRFDGRSVASVASTHPRRDSARVRRVCRVRERSGARVRGHGDGEALLRSAPPLLAARHAGGRPRARLLCAKDGPRGEAGRAPDGAFDAAGDGRKRRRRRRPRPRRSRRRHRGPARAGGHRRPPPRGGWRRCRRTWRRRRGRSTSSTRGGKQSRTTNRPRRRTTWPAGPRGPRRGFTGEYRDDRVVTFVDHMAAGMYRYRYLARGRRRGGRTSFLRRASSACTSRRPSGERRAARLP